MKKRSKAINGGLFTIIALLLTASTFLLITKDAYSHSTGPVIVYPQSYYVQPGQTLTQDMRICLMTGSNFTVSNIRFKGNYSTWAKVGAELPVEAVESTNGASSVDIPVTVTVPSNFTERITVLQAVVDVQTATTLSHGMSGLPIFIGNNTTAHQKLPDCNSFRDLQTAVRYGIITLIFVGGALLALGLFVYRRNKKKSKENKASLVAKVFSILFLIIGSLVMLLGLYLFYVQRLFLA